MRDREGWLAATLIELADTGTAEFDEAEYAQKLTERLAELLRPAEVGLLIPAAAGGGWPAVAAGSSARVLVLARLEARGAAGPCGDCCRTGHPVHAEFAAAVPWPEYVPAAVADGFTAVSALPVRRGEQAIGAVGVLSVGGRPLNAQQARITRLLTEAAAIGIMQQRALQESFRTSRQLQRALDSRVVIEQAKGAVAAWLGVTTGDAFELLRAYSRNSGRRLAQVAADVLGGQLPAPDLIASGIA